MSLLQEVAEWIHTRKHGATSAEVAAKFRIPMIRATTLVAQIKIAKRLAVRTEPAYLLDPTITDVRKTRVYIDKAPKPRWVKTPVVGVSRDFTVTFESITQAVRVGGFCSSQIRRCLIGTQKTHAGYQWMRAPK
ncbi:MAG: hypothetical protein ACRC8Q_01320 [Aeromonas sp.]